MGSKEKDYVLQAVITTVGGLLLVIFLFFILSVTAFASSGKTEVQGKIYEDNKDGYYKFSDADKFVETDGDNTYGVFSISGEISDMGTRDNAPSYEVKEGNLSLFYNYGDSLLNAGVDEWHLTEDKSKKIDTMTLDHKILKGAIIVQTSKDQHTWINEVVLTDAFNDISVRTDPIYSTTDVQLINGCFYRIIVAYELRIRTEDSNFLFINTDKYDYRKYVEVYEFYAYTDSGETSVPDSEHTYSLGNKVRVKNFDGYSGEKELDRDDIHYGWNLGNFFISGYTDEVVGTEGNIIFLKNVGDQVTLWFNLSEDINALNGDENLTITADKEGYDQFFETPKMDFGRGALIIRYTDYNNVSNDPTIYTNFLEANVTVGADTKVQLFEEGDYEVALDYEVTSDELIDKVGHYRISFSFSVRNGNCMAYPFDVVTGDELTNSSMTENGFRLDLAKSRYLNVNIKREVLKDSADGLVEDTRFNGPAQDGVEYTEEGIYTITVQNLYTNQFTVKKIYVGTNDVLRAYMTTGLSIPEINELIEQGATISEDGTIELATTQIIDQNDQALLSAEATDEDFRKKEESTSKNAWNFSMIILPVGILCAVVIIVVVFRQSKNNKTKEKRDHEGGVDE